MTGGFLGPFRRRAISESDRPLVTLHLSSGTRVLTHGSLMAGAQRYRALLAARGVVSGDVVFISLQLSADLLEAFLGAALAGCVPSLLPYPTLKQDAALFWSSHEALFRHTGAALIVTYPENRDAIARNVAPDLIRVATPDDRPDVAPDDPPAVPGPVACLQHSSGTTGLKKGVPLTHEAILAQVAGYADAIGLTERSRIVSWLPLYHDMGFVACFLMPLVTGCHVAMLDPFEWLGDPLRLLELAAADRADLTWLPNFAFQHLANCADDRRRVDLAGMRAFINCSETCKAETLRAFGTRFAGWGVRREQLACCYAMAEATFAVTQTEPGRPPREQSFARAALESRGRAEPSDAEDGVALVSCGKPIAGTQVVVRDTDRFPVAAGEVGEISIRSPSLFAGYFGRGQAQHDLFADGCYLTGDLGFVQDGELFVLGRSDDLIIVQGRNVFAHEIERLVGEVAGVKAGRSVAFGRYNAEFGSQDVIVVAEIDTGAPEKAAIRRGIRSALESTIGIVPGRIALVDQGWLIKTTSGKISRGGNRDKFLAAGRETA